MESDAQPEPTAKRRRVPRHRLIGWGVIFGLLVAAGLVYDHFTDPERIRARAQTYLQYYAHGPVRVGAASFSWFEGVRLFDVGVAEAPERGPTSTWPPASGAAGHAVDAAAPVFFCREVRLAHDLMSAFFGPLKIRSIVALQPTCSITRSPLTGRTNLMHLLRPHEDPTPDGELSVLLPTVELRDARVQVLSREAERARVVEDLRLTVRARPVGPESQLYNVVWQEAGAYRASGHSQINLETGRVRNVTGGLPWMSIEGVMFVLDAQYDGAGAWCDLLGLGGIVRATDYHLGWEDDAGPGRSATIQLRDASIAVPIDEQEDATDPKDRYLRFEHVDGRVRLTTSGISAAFTGVFHGADCQVNAAIRSGDVEKLNTLDDVDFEAQLTIKGLMLPRPAPVGTGAEVRFIQRWPHLVNFFRDYNPRGTADLEANVTKRAGRDEPVVVRHMRLTARGGGALCRYFPYPADNVTGVVEYTPDGIFIRGLRGEHANGVVTVDGHLTGPTKTAAKELSITGTGIPIDDALMEALPAHYGKLRNQFAPEGAVDAQLTLVQPAGTGGQAAPWTSKATINLRDVSARYMGFPYPVEGLTGTLTVEDDDLRLRDVVGHSGEARISLNGTAKLGPEGGGALELSIRGEDVALDHTLLDALPGHVRPSVEAFSANGRIDVYSELGCQPGATRVVHSSRVVLEDVDVRHTSIPVDVTDLLGQLTVTSDEVALEGITGRCRDAVISAEGVVRWTNGQAVPELVVRSRDLRVDEAFVAALPAKVRTALGDWQVDGPVAITVTATPNTAGDTPSSAVSAVVGLSKVTVRHPFFPIPFEEVRAEITLDPFGVQATGAEARYGAARLHLDFDTHRTDVLEEANVALSAMGLPLGDSLRGLLPEREAATWDRLGPSGSLDMHLEHLRYRRRDPGLPGEWSLSGYVELHDVGLRGVCDLGGMAGTLKLAGRVLDRAGGTSLDGNLTLSTASLLGQPLGRTSCSWSFLRAANSEGAVTLDGIEGDLHEGLLTGRVGVLFNESQTRYDVSTKAHSVQIEPLARAARAVDRADAESSHVRGLADGQLYLSGVVGEVAARRGGGRFEIRDGHIYRLPLILAILEVLNLSIPSNDAFDEARAEFFVVGNRVQLKDIVLRSDALALVGAGSLSLPNRAVDLDLVNVNPHRWARVPLLTDFVEGASRELIELHVTGPFSRPVVRARPFRSISDEFKRLFQKRKPKTVQGAGA